jgi:hypothetical protein
MLKTYLTRVINGAPQLRSLYYYRVAKEHGRNVGQVAFARAILKTIYAMLTKQAGFRLLAKEVLGQRHGVMAHSPSR